MARRLVEQEIDAMFLIHTTTGGLIRIDNVEELMNPFRSAVKGRDQEGEEEQDPTLFAKDELLFPSGESLPRCWTDADYRVVQTKPRAKQP